MNKELDFGLNKPFIHLVVSDRERFVDLALASFIGRQKAVLLHGKTSREKYELIVQFSEALKFPKYFGGNWDAFDEAINDLSWLGYGMSKYLIFITDADQILDVDNGEFEKLITILNDAGQEWANGKDIGEKLIPPKPFHTVLHCMLEKKDILMKRIENIGYHGKIEVVKQ